MKESEKLELSEQEDLTALCVRRRTPMPAAEVDDSMSRELPAPTTTHVPTHPHLSGALPTALLRPLGQDGTGHTRVRLLLALTRRAPSQGPSLSRTSRRCVIVHACAGDS